MQLFQYNDEQKKVAEEFRPTLEELTFNSKPLISCLTMVAEEHAERHAKVIINEICKYLKEVDAEKKIIVLYLMDSILKNIGNQYVEEFGKFVADFFAEAYEPSDKVSRRKMGEVRDTWLTLGLFPRHVLLKLDMRINKIDPSWNIDMGGGSTPRFKAPPTAVPNIHVNPKFPNIIRPPTNAATTSSVPKLGTPNVPQNVKPAEKKSAPQPPVKATELDRKQVSQMKLQELKQEKAEMARKMKVSPQNVAVSTTIHVNPSHMKNIASKGVIGSVLRDAPLIRDPRLVTRDPRLGISNQVGVKVDSKIGMSARDPRDKGVKRETLEKGKEEDKKVIHNREEGPSRLNLAPSRMKSSPSRSRTSPSRAKGLSPSTVKVPSPSRAKAPSPLRATVPSPTRAKGSSPSKTKGSSPSRATGSFPSRSKNNPTKALSEVKSSSSRVTASSTSRTKLPPSRESRKKVGSGTLEGKRKPASVKRVDKNSPPGSPSFRANKQSRREHIRARESSSDSSRRSKSPASKRSRTSHSSGSFSGSDSDHYEANKPKPVVFPKRKDVNTGSTDTGSTDTDLRQFTSSQKGDEAATSSCDKAINGSEETLIQSISLFGSQDVDLRLLPTAPPTAPTTVSLASAFPSTVDQDLRTDNREQRVPQLPLDPHMQEVRMQEMLPPGVGSPLADRDGSKKTIFNSPHAASWEKFREKNPEFREYQRQASTSDSDPNASQEESDFLGIPLRFPVQGRGFRSQFRGVGRGDWGFQERMDLGADDDDDDISSPICDEDSDDKYRMIIMQAEEQLNRNEITMTAYNRVVNEITQKREQDKIQEVQAMERRLSTQSKEFPSVGRGLSRPPRRGLLETPRGGPVRGRGGMLPPHEFRGGFRGRGFLGRGRGGPVPPEIDVFSDSSVEGEWTDMPELPDYSDEEIQRLTRDSIVRHIPIDKIVRNIRTYGLTAIIFMENGEPHVLRFKQGGSQCEIVFDNGKFVIPMSVGQEYNEFSIDGETHRIKLGVPTQELIIDDKPYQCFFSTKEPQPITVPLAKQLRSIYLHGDPPGVEIVPATNIEFVLGTVQMVINARKSHTLYLDASPQKFTINGKAFILKFVDSFRAVKINGNTIPVQFDGLPICINVRGYKQYLRFTGLPKWIVPGEVTVKGMDVDVPIQPIAPASFPPPVISASVPFMERPQFQSRPQFPPIRGHPPFMSYPPPRMGMRFIRPFRAPMPSSYMTSDGVASPSLNTASNVPTPIDVNYLLDSLKRSGLIGQGVTKPNSKEIQIEPEKDPEVPIEKMFLAENLRVRPKFLLQKLYHGMQCSSCGLRYPAEQAVRYSNHLDWHFRLNKRQQDSARKGSCRKWYLIFDEWLQFEEVEDVEERVPSMFEVEGGGSEFSHDDEDSEEMTVAVSGDPSAGVCPVCMDTFGQFFHQDTEEWKYQNALEVDGVNYHPTCHLDLLKSRELEKEAELRFTAEGEMNLDEPSKIDVSEEIGNVVEINDGKAEDSLREEKKEKPEIEEVPVEVIVREEVLLEDDAPAEEEHSEGAVAVPVTEQLDALTINPKIGMIKIKEEPMDFDEQFSTYPDLSVVDQDDDNCILDQSTEGDHWNPQAASETTIASSIDGNIELSEATSQPAPQTSVPRIKISIGKMPLSSAVNNHLDIEIKEPTECEEEFIAPPFTVDLEKKPSFRDISLTETELACRGLEVSGLCCVM